MALPLVIPVTVGVGKVVYDMWQSDKYEKQARSINYEAFSIVESAARKSREEYAKTTQTLLKLANRKKGIMNGSLPKFLEVYRKIIKINFKEVDSLDGDRALVLQENSIRSIDQMISVSGVSMSDKEIIGTFLFSWQYGGLSGAIKKDAKINLDLAYTRSDEAEVIASQYETAQIALKGIGDKAESFLKLLAQMNRLFLMSIQHTDKIIDGNGFDRQNYSADDKKALMNCINLAKAIKDILEAPLFEADGKVSQQANRALVVGDEYIRKLQSVS